MSRLPLLAHIPFPEAGIPTVGLCEGPLDAEEHGFTEQVNGIRKRLEADKKVAGYRAPWKPL